MTSREQIHRVVISIVTIQLRNMVSRGRIHMVEVNVTYNRRKRKNNQILCDGKLDS